MIEANELKEPQNQKKTLTAIPFKLILGIKNDDFSSIKDIIEAYLPFNIAMVDCSINVFKELKTFLETKEKLYRPETCVSIALKDDIHTKKAKIDTSKCLSCKKCVSVCSNDAIKITQNTIKPKNTIQIDEKKCVGCRACSKVCSNNAINFKEEDTFFDDIEKLKVLISKGIKPDWVELHFSTKKKKEIIKSFKYVLKNISANVPTNGPTNVPTNTPTNISICLSRRYFGTEKLVKTIIKLNTIFNDFHNKNCKGNCEGNCEEKTAKLMLQLDGQSINNGEDSLQSNLETLASFLQIKETLLSKKSNQDEALKIYISGGLNSKTIALLEQFELLPDGLSFGGYARKIYQNPDKIKKLMNNIENFYKKHIGARNAK